MTQSCEGDVLSSAHRKSLALSNCYHFSAEGNTRRSAVRRGYCTSGTRRCRLDTVRARILEVYIDRKTAELKDAIKQLENEIKDLNVRIRGD
jgi:hypothetical protein